MSDAMKKMGYRRQADLSPAERLDALRLRIGQGAKTFRHWWFGELLGLVPETLRQRISGTRSRLHLVMKDGTAELVSSTGGETTSLGAIDLEVSQSVGRALALSPQIIERPAPVCLSLPATDALRTRFFLPAAAERNLDQVVGFEFERVTPFRREEACYAWRISARDKAAHRIEIELTILPKPDVDAIVTAATKAGLRITAIEVAAVASGDPASFIPLEGAEALTSHGRARLVIGWLAATAAFLAVVCVVLPFVRASQQSSRLDVQLVSAQKQAAASLEVEKQIEALTSDRTFLIDRRRHLPTVTGLLDTVTRLTPDDAWLTELQIEGDQIHLSGAAESATGLLGRIDQSKVFSDAGFRSSITQDGELKRERFDISARIVPGSDGE